jgi:hypothetical protein
MPRRSSIRFILALAAFPAALTAQPADLARRVAQTETEAVAARGHYTFRQEVRIEDLDPKGGGQYKEIRDILFTPAGERTEEFVGSPSNQLKRLRLTEEDFRDIREVQPFLFTTDLLWLYRTKPRGEETVDGVDCWVLEVSPKQVLDGQRLFEGMFWVDKSDYTVVRSSGVAVPQVYRKSAENLFPRFTTFRERVDGKHRFPVHTFADDTLAFSTGALRMRMNIRYSNYKRFGASSTITFEQPKQP